MSQLPCMRPDSPRQTIIPRRERRLRFINSFGHRALRVGAAEMLVIVGDDWLTDEQLDDIARYHVDEETRRKRQNRANRAIQEARQKAPDPVITWPRPIWYEPAKGRPPGLRAEDVLPCDVEKGDAS